MNGLTPAEQRDQYTKVDKIYGALYGEGDVKGVLTRVSTLESAEAKRTGLTLAVTFFVSALISWFKG